jgi:hypothetical protein
VIDRTRTIDRHHQPGSYPRGGPGAIVRDRQPGSSPGAAIICRHHPPSSTWVVSASRHHQPGSYRRGRIGGRGRIRGVVPAPSSTWVVRRGRQTDASGPPLMPVLTSRPLECLGGLIERIDGGPTRVFGFSLFIVFFLSHSRALSRALSRHESCVRRAKERGDRA